SGASEGIFAIALGWITHGLLSLKAHVARGLGALLWFRRAETSARVARKRLEPRLVPPAEPEADASEADEDEDGGDEESHGKLKVTPRKQARSAAKPPGRKSSSGYEPPALSLLAAPKAQERFAPSMEALQENATALEHVLGDFGVRGEIINARPGP